MIEKLKIDMYVGIHESEFSAPQTILLDSEMALTDSRSRETNAIEDAIDYAAVVDLIQGHLAKRRDSLLDQLADETAQMFLW